MTVVSHARDHAKSMFTPLITHLGDIGAEIGISKEGSLFSKSD
jgi:hypothetical protein